LATHGAGVQNEDARDVRRYVVFVIIVAATDIAPVGNSHTPAGLRHVHHVAHDSAPAVKSTFSQAVETVAEFWSPTPALQQTAFGAIQSRHSWSRTLGTGLQPGRSAC
jgi:hypothetical protein